MTTFRNKNFVKRNYECTNIVACTSESAPNENWESCNAAILNRLTHLYTENGVKYFGFI